MSKSMPSNDIKTQGIVLRRTNYGEADRILNVITPVGRYAVIAKGVRKPRSKMAGGVEMFTLSEYNFHLGRSEMGIVTGARLIQYYGEILKDFKRMELMGNILKQINKASEQSDNAEYFEIARQCLTELNSGVKCALAESWFWLNLLKNNGEEVNLYRDINGDRLKVELRYDWDIGNDAFFERNDGKYGADEIKMLRLLTTATLSTARRVKVSAEMYDVILDLVRVMANI